MTVKERAQDEAEQIFANPADEVISQYEVDAEQGLSRQEAQQRLEQYGANRLREAKQRSPWEIFIEQFKSIVVLLLFIAAGAAFAFGDLIEAIAILLAIVINTGIGFFTELRAVRSMQALREMSRVQAKVRRDGSLQEIDAEEVVPGDILMVESGDVITADARVIEANKLQVDEAPLTGESVPVSKQTEEIEDDTELAERANMLYKGTTITRGSGEAVVVATGMETELGHISELVEEAEGETTPLEERLDQLGSRLAWLTIGLAAIISVGGLLAGRDVALMIETAIALAVAAIPEGLPIVATIALARGMKRMADRNALVEKLETVETLGATNVILTDKTGTLTENEMRVARLAFATSQVALEDETFRRDDETVDPQDDKLVYEALKIGLLCNNADLGDEGEDAVGGDPLEQALLYAGRDAKLTRAELLQDLPEEREVAFDNETNMMATYHRENGDYYVAVKGAPAAVFDVCTQIQDGDDRRDFADADREKWHDHNHNLASEGLRMLALAYKRVDSTDAEPYTDLIFVGLVGLLDPPREEVSDAIAECQQAGIRVVMVTGDQPETAHNIAAQLGLVREEETDAVMRGSELAEATSDDHIEDVAIFARITPEQKLDLIAAHQERGSRVAMTGDGVNDAPALQKADIGIAMGQRGTQAAREAADMVLQDDSFSSIVLAVRQGRIIFDNIRKFIIFLLSGNLAQIVIVGLASLLSTPLPLRPLVILYLNVIIDVFPALALGVGEGRDDVMNRQPRESDEAILTRNHWTRIATYALIAAASVLVVYFYLLGSGRPEIEVFTVSYLTLALSRLWLVFNMRDDEAPIFVNEVTRNPWVWGAIALSGVLVLASVYVPGLNTVLGTTPPPASDWVLILIFSFMPVIFGQVGKSLLGRSR